MSQHCRCSLFNDAVIPGLAVHFNRHTLLFSAPSSSAFCCLFAALWNTHDAQMFHTLSFPFLHERASSLFVCQAAHSPIVLLLLVVFPPRCVLIFVFWLLVAIIFFPVSSRFPSLPHVRLSVSLCRQLRCYWIGLFGAALLFIGSHILVIHTQNLLIDATQNRPSHVIMLSHER